MMLQAVANAWRRLFPPPEPLPRWEALGYLPLLRHLSDDSADHLDPEVRALFGDDLVSEAAELGVIRMGCMGTDAEYWTLTRKGRAALVS
jgi:hypothetical protein